jgi:hypothetical protein
MTKSISLKLILAMALVVSLMAFTALPAAAQSRQAVCEGVAAVGGSCGGGSGAVNNVIRQVVNILSSIVGVVAVIMIIWGGFKYVTSGGDSANVSGAKSTILYAIVGLIVVALAQAIVRFVLDRAT